MTIDFPELRLIMVNVLIVWSDEDEINLDEVIDYIRSLAELHANSIYLPGLAGFTRRLESSEPQEGFFG